MSELVDRLKRVRYGDGITFQMVCERVHDLKRPVADVRAGLQVLLKEKYLTPVQREQSGVTWFEFTRSNT